MDRLLEQRFLSQTVQKLGIFTFRPSIGYALRMDLVAVLSHINAKRRLGSVVAVTLDKPVGALYIS